MFKALRQKLKNNKGASLLVSSLLVVAIGLTGLTTLELSSSESSRGMSDINSKKAENYAHSGIESALYDLERGQNPAKTFAFSDGEVTITTDPDTQKVMVEGRVENGYLGQAVRTYQVDSVYSQHTMSVNASHASFENTADGGYLTGIYFTKSDLANKTDIIDKVTLSWNESYCIRQVTCVDDADSASADSAENSEEIDYTQYEDPDNSKKILICHIPQGNSDNPRTISISKNAWEDRHSDHDGDYLGACGTSETQNDIGEEEVFDICMEEDLTEQDQYIIDNYCTVSDGYKQVDEVIINNAVVFSAGATPNADTEAASSGEEMDLDDVTMNTAGNYEITSMRLDGEIEDGTWFTLNVQFKDGSSVEQTFQAVTRDIDLGQIAQQESDVVQGSIADGADFEEDNGTVTISDNNNYVLNAQVIASEITCGQNGPDIDVVVDIAKNDVYQNAFAGNAVQQGDIEVIENLQEENDYIVKATASSADCNNFTNTKTSTDATTYSLVNDDDVPTNWDGFGGQQPVHELLEAYIGDDGKIELAENQVIMLFELGTTDASSTASDYQDLVVLITVNLQ